MKYRRRTAKTPVENLQLKAALLFLATWVFVVVSVWAILPHEPEPKLQSYRQYEKETGWPIRNYLPVWVILYSVVIWIWALLSWMGMKFFKHAIVLH